MDGGSLGRLELFGRVHQTGKVLDVVILGSLDGKSIDIGGRAFLVESLGAVEAGNHGIKYKNRNK